MSEGEAGGRGARPVSVRLVRRDDAAAMAREVEGLARMECWALGPFDTEG
jgi:hypothetical protein